MYLLMKTTTNHESAEATNVVVVGTVRNVGKSLENEISNLNTALGVFQQVKWLLIESDSTDETVQVLEQLKTENSNFNYQSMGKLDQSMPDRTERIAYCRNSYLEEIERNPCYKDSDLIIMADLDGINNILSQSAIKSCFYKNDWDVCFANTKGPYYDIWALRHPTWCPSDCLQQFGFLKKHGWGEYAARFAAIYSKMITIPPDSPWIQVQSAFGGFALYKKKSVTGLRYNAFHEGLAICEHVSFHENMTKAGSKLFINPHLLNCKFPPHTKKLRFPDNLLLRLRILLSPSP